VQAKAALSDAQMAEGNRVARELDLKQIEAVRLIREMELLGIRIAVGNTLEAGYSKQNPAAIQADYAKKIADAQGSADKPAWFADEKGGVSLPTLAAVKQDVSRLQSEISKRQSDIDALTQKLNDQQAQVDKLQQQADAAKGREAVDAYRKASDARKVLADISAQIETAKANLSPFQHDLEVAQAQQSVVEGYIARVQDQEKQLLANWHSIQQAGAAQKTLAVTIVGTNGKTTGDAATIDAKSKELSDVLADAKKLADEAEQDLTGAVKSAGDAVSQAEELRRTVDPLRVEAESKDAFSAKIAYKNLLDVYSPTYFKMHQGVVETQLANMYGNQVAMLKAESGLIHQLTPILRKAGVKMPAGLEIADLDQQIKSATANADQHYSAAADELDGAANAALANDPRGNQAKLARIFTMYDWAKFARDNGDAKNAKARLDEAVNGREQILAAQPAAMVSLPDELLPPPPKVETPAPATAPTPASASATPADPATTADVKKTLSDVADAVMKGDTDTVKAHINATPIQQPTVDVVLSTIAGYQKFNTAMTGKFGPTAMDSLIGGFGMKMQIPKPEQMQQAIAAIAVQSTGPDSVAVAMPGQPQTLPLKKIDGMWKFDLTMLEPKYQMMLPTVGVQLKPAVQFINTIAADVEAGKYKSVDEVKAALQQGMAAMTGGKPPVDVAANPPAQPAQPAPAQPAPPKQQGRDVINNPANLPGVQ
jgi:predicted  nucleic acid-binding Zn-ribbon protein